MQYITKNGMQRRAHREEIDVVVSFCHGKLVPLLIRWKDGRTFPIDEVLEAPESHEALGGLRITSFKVRLGLHERTIYLEQTKGSGRDGLSDSFTWWVIAFDAQPATSDKKC